MCVCFGILWDQQSRPGVGWHHFVSMTTTQSSFFTTFFFLLPEWRVCHLQWRGTSTTMNITLMTSLLALMAVAMTTTNGGNLRSRTARYKYINTGCNCMTFIQQGQIEAKAAEWGAESVTQILIVSLCTKYWPPFPCPLSVWMNGGWWFVVLLFDGAFWCLLENVSIWWRVVFDQEAWGLVMCFGVWWRMFEVLVFNS